MYVIIYCIIKRKESSHHGNKSGLFFDIDGTLVNDSRMVLKSTEKAIRAFKGTRNFLLVWQQGEDPSLSVLLSSAL